MGGIAGALGNRDSHLVQRMCERLSHRGPDGEEYFHSTDIDVGGRRPNTADSVSGELPAYKSIRNKCIVLDGELYNLRELRQELLSRGHEFETANSTEVIIHLYEEYGAECLKRLRGAFAFAIADGRNLFLARDQFGVKPLYYSHIKERGLFIFASEIKALLQCQEMNAALDMQTMSDRFVLGHAFGSGTFFEGVKSLPAGHYLHATRQDEEVVVREEAYYELDIEADASITERASEEELISLLTRSVESHLIAHQNVGLTLSGGLDSSILAMIMGECHHNKIYTFTISDSSRNPDLKLSRSIADQIQAEHSEVELDFNQYLDVIPQCVLAEEQPTALLGLPFYYLCRQIGRRVKVCLNGGGADELFGGGADYFDPGGKILGMQNRLAKARRFDLSPGDGVLALIDYLSSARTSDEALERWFRANLTDLLIGRDLEVSDRYSMASGIEIRFPFLDSDLVNFVNRLPLNFKVNRELRIDKYILKKVALNSFGRVMTDIVLRQKVGFPAAGSVNFAKFNALCESNLPDAYAKKNKLAHHFTSIDKDGRLFCKRNLLLFDIFSFIFIEQRGNIPVGFNVAEFIKEKSSKITLAYPT